MRKHWGKKATAYVLTLCMVMSLLVGLPPMEVKAATGGELGTGVSWSFDTTSGTLTFSGSGVIPDYERTNPNSRPWNSYYNSMKKVIIGSGITRVGNCAFYGNIYKYIESIEFPDSLTSIGQYAFGNCIGIKEFTLPEGLESIEQNAFDQCKGITTVILPDSLTSIGQYAFSGCSGITTLTLPEGLTSISQGAFYGCKGITTLTLPKGLESIDEQAFVECSGITSITFPETLTRIDRIAFGYCTGITTVILPKSLKSIGDEVFVNCIGIKEFTLPEGLESIGQRAFENCRSITTVTLPESLTSIGNMAFSNCKALDEVIVKGKTPPALTGDDGKLFGYTDTYGNDYNSKFVKDNTTGIKVPTASYDQYISKWANYQQYIKGVAFHTHNWEYAEVGNVISAYCSSSEGSNDCTAYGSNNAKTLTLSAPSDSTYNGQHKTATVTGQEEFVDLTKASVGDINYEGVSPTEYAKSTTAPTDAGTYKATLTVTAADEAKTEYTAEKEFTIEKADATCNVTANTLTYNGNEQELVTSTINGCTGYYRIGENGDWSTTVPKAKGAGTYEIYYYGEVDSNYNSVGSEESPIGSVSVTIAKKALSAGMITINPASKVFDGEPTTPVVTVSDMNETTQCITAADYEISGADTQEEVGDYTIIVTAKDNGNYSGSAQKTWSITGDSFDENDITVTPYEDVYDGAEHGIDIVLSGAAEGAEITYCETESGTYTTTKPTYKDVKTTDGGTYTVYYKVNRRGYYEKKGSSTVKINPKEVGIEWTHTDDLVYNAAEQKPTATATGLIEGDTCNVTVTGGQTNSNKKAGSTPYTATADSLDNANYKLPATKTTAEFTIAQKEISVNWTNTTLTYNREVQKPTANLEGVCSGDTCDIAVEGGQTDAGDSYQATATLHNDNYKIADGQSVTYTIKPKPIAEDMVALDSEDHLYIYAGAPITPSVTVKDGAVVLVSGEAQEYVLSGTTSASDFGDYELQVVGRGNYTGEVKVAWKIADSLAPTGTISIAEDSWTEFWNGVTFGRFYNQTQIVTITAEDPAGEGGAAASGIDKIYYYKSPAILTYDKVAALAEGIWTEYKDSITVDSDDKLVIYAKITDKSGNVTYISTEGLVLDKTAPDITGVTDGQKYCGKKTITVKDANLDKVTINGAEVTLVDETYPLSATEETGKEFSIVATDKAGNSKTVTVTICKGHIWPDDWTVLKAATETKDGKEEMKCSNGCGHKKIRVIPALGSPEDLYGNFEKDAEVALGAPIHEATLNTSKETLVNSMFGGSLSDPDARVWIEIDAVDESSISDSDKGNMIQKAEEELGENPTLTYFDASLYKKLNNIQSKISNPGCHISISIVIPDTLLNHDSLMVRDYKIIRLHDGSVQTISGTFDESTKEFTFETDQFSTYAIAFKDKPKYSGGNSGSGGGGSYNPVTGITITSEKATLTKAGETLQLTVNVSPGNASNKKVTWKSDNEAVATVDSNGKVTAVGNGTATITATTESGNKSVTCVITVNITPEETADPSVPADTDEPGTTKPEKVTSDFGALKAKSVKQTSTTVTLSWTKQSDADGYLIYGSRCNSNGKKYTRKLLKTIKGNRTLTWTQKNLDKATYYKYQVKAYKIVNGKKVIIANSVDVHVATKGGKYCVASAVEVTKLAGKKAGKDLKLSLTKGKTAQITAGETPAEKNKTIKHHRELCYESSNRKVATVTKSGKIKAVGKGTCKIWVYAQNGVYQKVKVTVK